MKLAATALIITIVLAISIVVTFPSSSFGLHLDGKSRESNFSSPLLYAEAEEREGAKQNNIVEIKSIENKTPSPLSSALPSINQVQGTVIVTTKVINEGGGDKKPSDFILTIHGNEPSPASFPGNSSGTPVKLHMGMYSVTEKAVSGYNSTSSDDCSGGMMSVEAKKCTITNIFSKPVVNSR